MTFWRLIRRNLRFHARAHLGVVLGAAIGSAALVGALVVGDSVRVSLTDMALRRLGRINFALSTPDSLFDATLGNRLWAGAPTDEIPGGSGPSAYINSSTIWPQTWALMLPGVAVRQDGRARANHVNVLGVEAKTGSSLADLGKVPRGAWAPGTEWDRLQTAGVWLPFSPLPTGPSSKSVPDGTALVNQTLARQLGVRDGDQIVLRVRKPSALALDAAVAPRDEASVAIRLKVGGILPSYALGDFSLTAQPAPPANLFLPLDFLANEVGARGRANLLLTRQYSQWPIAGPFNTLRSSIASWLRGHAARFRIGPPGVANPNYYLDQSSLAARAARLVDPHRARQIPDRLVLPWLDRRLSRAWLPEDAGLTVLAIEQPERATGGEYTRPCIEVSSSQLFLQPAVVGAALTPRTVLLTHHEKTYGDTWSDVAFAQFVTNGVRVLTYLANLIRAGDHATPYSMVTAADGPYLPRDMRDDEIIVNQWLADDLQVKPGDSVALSYYVVDSGSRLVERTNTFRVRQIVPLKGIYADRTLMPEFPGLAKAESTHDWDAGFPLVYPIRAKDEAYWKAYRGTPKAFVTLAAGQAMWGNRFGALTAIRYEVPTNTLASTCREAVYRNLLANLRPEDVGLHFEPVREQALKAAAQGQDFGQLFIGFSLFLVVAALVLMAMLFQLGLEQRASEVGILLALGLRQSR